MRLAHPFLALTGLLGFQLQTRLTLAQLVDNPSLSLQTATPTLNVLAASTPASSSAPYGGVVRNYYIQISEYLWDYMPSGLDLYHGGPPSKTPAKTWFANTTSTIGRVYIKALYRAYTDATFSNPVNHEAWLGTLGPIIRAEVGDQIRVLVSNRATFNFSMHPHGVMYTIANEGAMYEGSAMNDIIGPNSQYEYVWNVPSRAGPGPNDGSSVLWGYHSHVMDAGDLYAGLTGPMIIYNKGVLDKKTGLPSKTYDREYVIQLLVFDENESPYLARNVKNAKLKAGATSADGFNESNLKHAINGFAFNNLPGITMNVGDKVRWYCMGFGTEMDVHALNFHGNTGLYDNHRIDTMELLPAVFRTIDMIPDNPGQWMMQCETTDHTMGGMIGSYQVLPSSSKTSSSKTTKKPTTTKKSVKAATTKKSSKKTTSTHKASTTKKATKTPK